jgi:demethylmenaquinone methyltransferase/2-methoxy-6-polyprenyl-1,4-benzoquinol methylase
MYLQETIKPYNQDATKTQQVEAMFDNIASTYDTLNHRLSWNIDRYWRKKAIKRLAAHAPKKILDIATGTGDFAIQACQQLPEVQITAVDISEGMMQVGRQKVKEKGLQQHIQFEREDCTALSYPDNTFDAITTAFGIRNFASLDKGLEEMCRVLRPGGQLCILELTQPMSFPMRQLFHIYSHTVLPLYGRLISKDTEAYSYLTKTIEAFPQGERMMDILRQAGFRETAFQRLTLGICTLYFATK